MSSAADAAELVERIDVLLPQTQCTKCGYAGCQPYAEAIAGGAAINQCPPGGAVGIAKLAALLQRTNLPLNPANGREGPLQLAVIDEALCIGCALCIDACPVDAIVGAPKRMHTVISSRCTGCDLCLPPCPMDCIAMVDAGREWTEADAGAARACHAAHSKRLAEKRDGPQETPDDEVAPPPADAAMAAQKQAIVAAALERARRRRGVPAR
jgi:electron transport complex protein RnfB